MTTISVFVGDKEYKLKKPTGLAGAKMVEILMESLSEETIRGMQEAKGDPDTMNDMGLNQIKDVGKAFVRFSEQVLPHLLIDDKYDDLSGPVQMAMFYQVFVQETAGLESFQDLIG